MPRHGKFGGAGATARPYSFASPNGASCADQTSYATFGLWRPERERDDDDDSDDGDSDDVEDEDNGFGCFYLKAIYHVACQ